MYPVIQIRGQKADMLNANTLHYTSTGSAGLIQTIRAFSGHAWVAAVLGLVATVGWTVQGVGNAYYYRQVSSAAHP